MKIHFILALYAVGLIGCSSGSSSSGGQSSFAFDEEPSFCTQVQSYPGGVPVTGRAQFIARQVAVEGLQGPLPAQDIKFAEVEVLDSGGSRIQCGETDATGNFSFVLPKSEGQYSIRILSRALNPAHYQASVLDSPTKNLPFALETTVSLSAPFPPLSVGLLTARHDGKILGGAFNILDQVYKANVFLRTNTSCAAQGNICQSFSVAPPVRLYWTAGLSPYSYYGYPASAISFFSPLGDSSSGIRRGIYIQGGLQGDVNCSDTDHFDNSVILHEYGHFLEDSFAKSDSPGGSHNGNFVIDPRLSWSEGWSNFFQTAVLGNPQYRDTIGNATCAGGTYLAVNLNLDSAQPSQDRMFSGTTVGEGHFREVSVSRVLYHTFASGTGGGASLGFALIWKTFSDAQVGLRNPAFHFRNMGLFNELIRSLVFTYDGGKLAALDSAQAVEYQVGNQNQYALPVSLKPSSSCSFNLQGVADVYSFGKFYSHLVNSNDFYAYYFDGSQPIIELRYGGTSVSDLDLDVYSENYIYNDLTKMVQRSHHPYPESAGGGYEVVNLTGQPPGTYLINVRVNSAARGNAANYYLSNPAGERFCP